jgi:ferredoxin
VTLPAPPAPPREAVTKDEAEAITGHLRELGATLLRDKGVSMVLGYRAGGLPGQMVPAFVTRPEEANLLAWSDQCHNNLGVYLAGAQHVTGKIAIVVKQCDARGVANLLQETKIKREDVTLIGVSCGGVSVNDQLALKCYACDGDAAHLCDYTVMADGVKPGAVTSPAKRAVAADPRDMQIAHLSKLPSSERWAFWQEQFGECIRCYGCRAVCPSCYCESCITEKNQPQWIPTSIDGPGNTAWNFIRAYHLAGRCAGCDECARVCPSRLRLDLLNRRVAMEMEQRFHHHAGEQIDGAPPLAAFQPDDPQEFIY